jgi:hypothetical protein
MSYDLRRLRAHGLITRIPRSHRYRLTDTGLHHAMLLSHVHTRLLMPGLAQLADPDPPAPTALRTAPATTAGPSISSARRPDSPHEHQDLTRSCRLRRPQQAPSCGRRRFLHWRRASSARSILSPHDSRHCFKSVRRRGAATCQRGQESAKQAGPVSHNPNPTDFNDETQ